MSLPSQYHCGLGWDCNVTEAHFVTSPAKNPNPFSTVAAVQPQYLSGMTQANRFCAGYLASLTPTHAWYYHRGVMRDPRKCLLWAIYLIGGGLLLSGLVGVGLLSVLKGQLMLSASLWLLARSLLVLSWLCMGAGIVLLVRGVRLRGKK